MATRIAALEAVMQRSASGGGNNSEVNYGGRRRLVSGQALELARWQASASQARPAVVQVLPDWQHFGRPALGGAGYPSDVPADITVELHIGIGNSGYVLEHTLPANGLELVVVGSQVRVVGRYDNGSGYGDGTDATAYNLAASVHGTDSVPTPRVQVLRGVATGSDPIVDPQIIIPPFVRQMRARAANDSMILDALISEAPWGDGGTVAQATWAYWSSWRPLDLRTAVVTPSGTAGAGAVVHLEFR